LFSRQSLESRHYQAEPGNERVVTRREEGESKTSSTMFMKDVIFSKYPMKIIKTLNFRG